MTAAEAKAIVLRKKIIEQTFSGLNKQQCPRGRQMYRRRWHY